MIATVEISMYPLREDYETQVLKFLKVLHSEDGLSVKVNAMSTQVQGDFDLVFDSLKVAMKTAYQDGIKASFVIKVLEGKLDLNYAYRP